MKALRISRISALHYAKLVFRSLLLIWAALTYLLNRPLHHMSFIDAEPRYRLLLVFVWLIFCAEMVSRFFPLGTESMGCQKQFAKNFISTGADLASAKLRSFRSTLAVVLAWVLLNGSLGWLYFREWIDDGILFLISLFYSVSDMICILFFCPFQTLFMKNRCCTTCRIYNWDYLMMFTPLIFVRSFYTWSLAGMALVLLFRWELTVRLHPERFLESHNDALRCANCTEKLCVHKKQLHTLWRAEKAAVARKAERAVKRAELAAKKAEDAMQQLKNWKP